MRLYLAIERRRRGTGTYQVKCAGLSGLITLYVPNPALTRGAILSRPFGPLLLTGSLPVSESQKNRGHSEFPDLPS